MEKNIDRYTGLIRGVLIMQICTFFGHKDSNKKIEPILQSTLMDLIINKGVAVFYVENHGNFDSMVKDNLQNLKKFILK